MWPRTSVIAIIRLLYLFALYWNTGHWIGCWWRVDASMLSNNIVRLVKSVSFQSGLDGTGDVCGALEHIHLCFIPQLHYQGPLAGQITSEPTSVTGLLIDWNLPHNLIFYLLISQTEAASCHSSQAGINVNIVPVGKDPGRGRGWLTGLQSSGSWTSSDSEWAKPQGFWYAEPNDWRSAGLQQNWIKRTVHLDNGNLHALMSWQTVYCFFFTWNIEDNIFKDIYAALFMQW